jgi:hypothetical protein
MNAKEWLHYFEQNCNNRPEPAWHLASPLDDSAREILCRSLSHFQLGESGEGKYLLQQAREQVRDDVDYARALALFIAEEREHARLLGLLVRRFGGELIHRHWTHALFRLARRTLGLNFELQVLVIAEIVGIAYYRLLQMRTCDPVLDQVCLLLLRDEAPHIDFHTCWLRDVQARWLPAERAGWSLQFQLLFAAAANMAWFDHREGLKSSGGNKREFFGIARRECIQFLRQLGESRSDLTAKPAFT